jgi:bifunctional non-homologous end joining protein LigD
MAAKPPTAAHQRGIAEHASSRTSAKPASAAEPVADALKDYSAKRTFEATPEPAPAPPRFGAGPLLFVVQQHAARRLHWDFRLELDGVLKSWAVPKGPSLDPGDKRLAVQVEDHPYEYGSFEGVIPSNQYGSGEVIVWDCGVYSPDEDDQVFFHDREAAQRELRAGLAKGKLSIFLRGEKLKGSFALVRSGEPKNWFLIKHKDGFARKIDVAEQDQSVLSGMSVEALRHLPPHPRIGAEDLAPTGPAEALPRKLSPMLAEPGDRPFADPDWMAEPKLDGYRVLAFIAGSKVELRSRRGLDLTAAFPEVVAELSGQAVSAMVLDGEIIAFGPDGKPSFNALQNRVQLKTQREIAAADRTTPCVFFAFDLLHFAGVDVRKAPYVARRRYLAQCLLPSPHVQLVHADEDGVRLYEAALASGFEGVVAKRKSSAYQAGRRSPNWLKIKSTRSAEFVIGGYTKGKGARESLGALLVGYWDEGELRYAGHVGSGFAEDSLEDVKRRFDSLRTTQCPFAQKPPLHNPTAWVKPELAAEIEFAAWTPDGYLRAPVFLRLREDVDAKDVRRPAGNGNEATPGGHGGHGGDASIEGGDARIEDVLRQLDSAKLTLDLAVGAERIRLTNLDRLYWPAERGLKQPEVTKRDLLRYLAQVAPLMLPHLADRPLTMIRMPEGIRGERFFQKHWEPKLPPYVETVTVYSESKAEQGRYLLCNNLPTLLWLAQIGTLEYHVWHSRAKPGPDSDSQSTDFSSSLEAMESSVLNYPDYLVFDIDPYIYSGKEAPGAEPELNPTAFEKGKEVAFRLREVLQSMALAPVVKTSGKTGLHVFVPIERTIDFDAARHVCETVGRHLLGRHPKDITMDWAVKKRTGKIFIDYNMNVRGKTLNVAYSPRGVPGAPISMPLTWKQLERAHPLDFRIDNVVDRLLRDGDVWKDALTRKHSLERALAA